MTFTPEEMERARRVVEAQMAKEARSGSRQARKDRRIADAGTGAGGGALVTPAGAGSPNPVYTLGSYSGLRTDEFGRVYKAEPPAEKKKPLPEELQVDALHGWRWARLVAEDNGVALKSLHHEHVLKPEEVARCMGKRTTTSFFSFFSLRERERCAVAPDPECACGFYALREHADLGVESLVNATATRSLGILLVELEVELSGRMIVHTKGIRGQHQRILGVGIERACQGTWMCENDGAYVHFGKKRTRVLCEACATERKAQRLATPAQLSGRLGVEVRWS